MEAERFMVDDLLNFTLDVCEEEEDENYKNTLKPPSSSLELLNPNTTQDPEEHQSLSPEFVEEELEWLSNKDAFPEVETCLELLSANPSIVLKQESPVSVLENTTASTSNGSTITTCAVSNLVPVRYPVKARSKRRLRRRHAFSDLSSQHCWRWNRAKVKVVKKELPRLFPPSLPPSVTRIGRRCQHCQVDNTPQWRAGPMGPKTLCNACGVRYKSGRLVPEYRPASSPTFSSLLHSNSHRKVMEMRKQKEMVGMSVMNEACEYRVG